MTVKHATKSYPPGTLPDTGEAPARRGVAGMRLSDAAHVGILSRLLRYPITIENPEHLAQRIVDDIAAQFGSPAVCLWERKPAGYQVDIMAGSARLPLEGEIGAIWDQLIDLPGTVSVHLPDIEGWSELGRGWHEIGQYALFAAHRQGDGGMNLLVCILDQDLRRNESQLSLFVNMANAALQAKARVDALRRSNHLSSSLNRAHRYDALGSLASGVAHEINTPIQFIASNLEFLSGNLKKIDQAIAGAKFAAREKQFLRSEIAASIRDSCAGIEQISEIVSSIRGVGHPGNLEFELVDINSVLGSAARLCLIQYRDVADLLFDLEPELPLVEALPNELSRTFINLIVNAAAAIADKAEGDRQSDDKEFIVLRTRLDLPDQVIVEIEDSGCGIAPENLERIFDPYFTTRPVGQGTGQGLALVYDMVKRRHGGDIHVISRLGEGTVFTIRLPLQHGADK